MKIKPMKGIRMAALIIFCVIIAGFLSYKIVAKKKNEQPKPDYYQVYKSQDMVPEGKVGVFVTGLIMPETMDASAFYNITIKIFNSIIPWPFRLFSKIDKGVALLDPVKYH